MPTVTIPRSDVTGHEVAAALRAALDTRYNVLPEMTTARRPLAKPQPAPSDNILVGTGSNRLFCAHVTISRYPGGTQLRISPGGLGWEVLVNSLGIVRTVRRVLVKASGLIASPTS